MATIDDYDLHPEDADYTVQKLTVTEGITTESVYFEGGFSSDVNDWLQEPPDDPVHHPKHYTRYKGLEVIQLTEQMNFNRGNAVKYVARAGLKSKDSEVEDLEKAKWYIQREIDRLKSED